VDIAEDGYKAIALSKEKKYDVILLDIKMPGIDAYRPFRK